jgi:hypothetical protein
MDNRESDDGWEEATLLTAGVAVGFAPTSLSICRAILHVSADIY